MNAFITLLYWPLVLLSLTCSTAFPQKSRTFTFKDYPIVENLDSLSEVVYKQKNNPEQYLRGLITLEKNRTEYIDQFGQELPTIKTLAYQLHSPLAIATYHYLQGLFLREPNLGGACRNTLEAIHYFEAEKDTTGILSCYFSMLLFSTNAGSFRIKNMQSPSYYYGQVDAIGKKSTAIIDKLIRIRAILAFEKLVRGEQSFSVRINDVKEALSLLNINPKAKPLQAALYNNIAAFYERHKESKQALKYGLTSFELYKKKSSKICITIYFNLGDSYFNVKEYAKAEPLLNEVIRAIEQMKEQRFNLLLSTYFTLAEIQFINKQYDLAWASQQKVNELFIKRHQKLKSSLFEELNTQYDIDQKEAQNRLLLKENELAKVRNQKFRQDAEIDRLTEKDHLAQSQHLSHQKEAENRLLVQKNQSIEALNKQYQLLLVISVCALIVVSILIYLLHQSNVNQKQLMLFRDKLYTVIAHDLREPINSLVNVGTLLHFLIRQNRNEEVKKVTQQIDLMGLQTSLLLNNLLEWGKNNYFEQQSDPQPFDAAPLLHELTQLYKGLAEAKGVLMSVAIPAAYPLTANPKDLALIIRNLLDNALKHTPKGGTVTLTATPGQATIEVQDSGEGITADQLAYLQQVFSGKRKPQVGTHGLGLGLVLINDVARRNGATLRFSSQPGEGTLVAFLLH